MEKNGGEGMLAEVTVGGLPTRHAGRGAGGKGGCVGTGYRGRPTHLPRSRRCKEGERVFDRGVGKGGGDGGYSSGPTRQPHSWRCGGGEGGGGGAEERACWQRLQ